MDCAAARVPAAQSDQKLAALRWLTVVVCEDHAKRGTGGIERALISIQVNAAPALGTLQRVAAASRDRRTPNRQLSVQLYGHVLRGFQAGGNPRWVPLASSTLAQKLRKGYSSTPLIRTGHYRQSFRPFSDNDRAGVGSEVPYSKYLEGGTRRMPARQALPSQDVALDYAIKIYDRWIASITRQR